MKDNKRWRVLTVSLIINLFIGSIYAFSVFSKPLMNEFGWSAGATALAFTIANGISPITMISGGALQDKYGPKWIVFAGGLLFGGGLIASGFVYCVSLIYVTYGLGAGFGMGLVYSCTIANTVKFFPDKKGIIAGLTTCAYGLSAVIIAPVAQKLIYIIGVSNTFKVLGISVLIVVCIGALFIERAPVHEETQTLQNQEKNWPEMLQTPTFYLITTMLTIGATAGLMIISQASSMAQELIKVSPERAAIVVSMIAIANSAGRIVWGNLSDKIGRYQVLPIMFGILAFAMIALSGVKEGMWLAFMLCVMAIGFSFGFCLIGVIIASCICLREKRTRH